MEKTVWLSFDLGIRGDYNGLYEWLDNQEAKECSDSIAVFKYNVKNNLIEDLKKDLSENVSIKNRDRIYLIWKQDEKVKGKFLFGKRKASSWEGYGSFETEPDEDF
ncbi:hypothetical protein QUF70_12775 [Desulfobacterales bacterium HSG17]|nr:hypothetical protein [Desulfobacterales bacterium HSG17]